MDQHRNTYFVRKSSWGIIIIQEGFIIKEFELLDSFYELGNGVYLNIIFNLSEDYLRFLIDGAKWVLDYIDDDILITISNIELNPNDFQKEGLFFSMAEWLSTYYDFALPEFEVNFDRTKNEYVYRLQNTS